MNYRFTGLVSTSFAASGNWVDDSGSVPGTTPGAGDSVYLDRATTYALAGSDISAANLASFNVSKDYNRAIGTSTTPLSLSASLVILDGSKMSSSYLLGAGASGLANLQVLGSLGTLTLDGAISVDTIVKGTISIASGAVIAGASLSIGNDASKTNGIDVTIAAGATIPSSVTVIGTLTSSVAITTLSLIAGKVTQTGNITTYTGYAGTLDYRSGTVTTSTIYNILDLSQSTLPRTFTNLTAGKGHRITLDNSLGSVVFSNGIDLACPSLNMTGLAGKTISIA